MDIQKECERVLNSNWRGGYTVPSPHLYPFQWNWDSGFIALGYLHMDPEKALQEMEHLFLGQWDNGFLPHIVFHNEENLDAEYFPSADYWNSHVSEQAPKGLRTTGISQPPIHGYVLERIFEKTGSTPRLTSLFEKLVHYHRYLYEVRDTRKNSLLSIWHNWETGMDNSPWWDHALQRINAEELVSIELNRKDVKAVENPEETRPSDDEYRRYLWLLLTLQRHKYEACPEDFPFQMHDLAFNSLLLASTESMLRLGPALGCEVDGLEARLQEGRKTFNELMWNEEDGCYYPFDLLSNEQIRLKGAASFLPLFGGVPDERQARRLADNLEQFEGLYGVPSFDHKHPLYERKKYWRGPIWINLNYIIYHGLVRFGFGKQAETLKARMLEMVERYGLREYFPVDGNEKEAYGGTDFSWSASLILDLIKT